MSVGTLRRHRNRRCVSISAVCFLAVCFLSVWAALAPGSAAQSTGGRVRGTIIDQSGGGGSPAPRNPPHSAPGKENGTESRRGGGEGFFLESVGAVQNS